EVFTEASVDGAVIHGVVFAGFLFGIHHFRLEHARERHRGASCREGMARVNVRAWDRARPSPTRCLIDPKTLDRTWNNGIVGAPSNRYGEQRGREGPMDAFSAQIVKFVREMPDDALLELVKQKLGVIGAAVGRARRSTSSPAVTASAKKSKDPRPL